MTSDALINKYRPPTLDAVIGQSDVVRALRAKIERDDTHTFLFMGPSGTGKTTLARIVTQDVGCEPAGIEEVDAASYTSIDNMRVLMDSARHRPIISVSKKRAFIIDECHALSKPAIQSLLKSLEQPPAWQYWMLCTTEGGSIPETIKTRCAVFNLKDVDRKSLSELLDRIADKENFPCETDVIDLCVAEAHGSPRRAISYLGVCSQAKTREEAASLLQTALGGADAFEFARALANNAPWKRLQELLLAMKDQNPESIRHVVRGYFTKAVLEGIKRNAYFEDILRVFGRPFPAGDGITPVILAVIELEETNRI